jgi:tRNA(Ile)-lysidine synthase TilS/MesJ
MVRVLDRYGITALNVVDATYRAEEVRRLEARGMMDEDERRNEIRQILHRLEELRKMTQRQMAETVELKERLARLERPSPEGKTIDAELEGPANGEEPASD